MQTATNQYQLFPAPGPLAIVQDFLNTVSSGRTVRRADLLDNPIDANHWVTAAWNQILGFDNPPSLTEDDLDPLRRLRGELTSVLIGRGEHSGTGGATFLSARAELELGPDGVRLNGFGTGHRMVTATVLGAVYEAQISGALRRLKVCPNNWCQVSFYDRSKNNAAVWHNSTTCGNIANVRASRARKKDQQYARFSAN
jgi:hypothetical protein